MKDRDHQMKLVDNYYGLSYILLFVCQKNIHITKIVFPEFLRWTKKRKQRKICYFLICI